MKKKKRLKIVFIVLIVIVALIVGGGFFMMRGMKKIADDALAKQVNVDIDMSQVKDGTYKGDSDGGMVKVKVEVTVKDHKITKIDLLEHENMKGKPAEAMIPEMVIKNTDKVDGVSGATLSSKTIKNAVNVALQQSLEQ